MYIDFTLNLPHVFILFLYTTLQLTSVHVTRIYGNKIVINHVIKTFSNETLFLFIWFYNVMGFLLKIKESQ